MLMGHPALINIFGDIIMQKLLLTELIHDLEQEMLRLGYSNRSMKFFRRRWRTLLQFAKEREEHFYSEQLGIDFVEKHFNILEKADNRKLSEENLRELRVIHMIGDFQLHRTILPRCCKHKDLLIDPSFIILRNQFQLYCEDKGLSKATTKENVRNSARFMHYLASQRVTDCTKISLPLIHGYIKTLVGYGHRTIQHNIACIRIFLRFLLEIGEIQTDFAAKIPMIQVRQQTRVPSVWTKDELQKLIAAIDRGAP
jgi:integrase/recombinase XerD